MHYDYKDDECYDVYMDYVRTFIDHIAPNLIDRRGHCENRVIQHEILLRENILGIFHNQIERSLNRNTREIFDIFQKTEKISSNIFERDRENVTYLYN